MWFVAHTVSRTDLPSYPPALLPRILLPFFSLSLLILRFTSPYSPSLILLLTYTASYPPSPLLLSISTVESDSTPLSFKLTANERGRHDFPLSTKRLKPYIWDYIDAKETRCNRKVTEIRWRLSMLSTCSISGAMSQFPPPGLNIFDAASIKGILREHIDFIPNTLI